MKKAKTVLIYLLFILTALYPAVDIITACFGYRFELIRTSIFAVTIAILAFSTVVLDIVCKGKPENKAIPILTAIIAPLSFINFFYLIVRTNQIPVMACIWISAGCCIYLTARYGKPLALKIITLVLSVLMILPAGLFSFMAMFSSEPTVVQTIISPNGEYYAEVIDSNQGALGGDTYVDVYKNSSIHLILFKLQEKPQRVFEGNWGIYKDMQIYWKDNNCLVINTVEYEIE